MQDVLPCHVVSRPSYRIDKYKPVVKRTGAVKGGSRNFAKGEGERGAGDGGPEKGVCAPKDVFCSNFLTMLFQSCRQSGGGGGGGLPISALPALSRSPRKQT